MKKLPFIIAAIVILLLAYRLRTSSGLHLSWSAMHGHDVSSLTHQDRTEIHNWLEEEQRKAEAAGCTIDQAQTDLENARQGFDNVRIYSCRGRLNDEQ